MKQLWAPWRMEYVENDNPDKGKGCIFCRLGSEEEDRKRLILHRGDHAFVIMNKFPYSNGHLMVAPYRHTADLNLSKEEALEMHSLLALCRDVLSERFSPDGFNVGMNLGKVAGAGVADHLHMHIVPRWNGDTNFMPVFADVRVIPQHLDATYELLSKGFARRRP